MRSEQEVLDDFGKLIDMLEHFRIRPAMYLGVVDVDLAVAWISGFNAPERFIAKEIADDHWFDFRKQAVEARGLEWSARHPAEEFRGRGLSAEKIIDELLLIEIAVLKSAQNQLIEKPTPVE